MGKVVDLEEFKFKKIHEYDINNQNQISQEDKNVYDIYEEFYNSEYHCNMELEIVKNSN